MKIGDMVVYITANGERRAAIVNSDPPLGRDILDLTVFNTNGQPCWPYTEVPWGSSKQPGTWTWK